MIDSHFINQMEYKNQEIQWKRVDSDSADKLIDTGTSLDVLLSEKQKETVKSTFEKVLNDSNKIVAIEGMSADELPAIVTQNEFMRRMNDMQKNGGGNGMFGAMPSTYQITVNGNHPLIEKLANETNEDDRETLAKQISDLALLSQNLLSGADLTAFIKRSASRL